MLRRQKTMFATILACTAIALISTLVYKSAADRVAIQYMEPELNQVFTKVLKTALGNSLDMANLNNLLEHMSEHYLIHEMALYDNNQERLLHTYDQNYQPVLSSHKSRIPEKNNIHQYSITVFSPVETTFSFIIVNRISTATFFLLDTLISALFILSISAMIIFILYYRIRSWEQQPYDDLLSIIQQADSSQADERLVLHSNDKDIQPLVQGLNDLFWRREQRTLHLETAHQQADSARLRATKLSNETRLINDNLAKEISIRRGIEVQLKNTQLMLDGILNAMPSAIFAIDLQYRIVQCNEQAGIWLHTQHPQLVGRHLLQLIPELAELDELLSIKNSIDSHEPKKIERLDIKSFDQAMVCDLLIYPMKIGQQLHIVVRIDDVSQRQRMEEMMVQTEKMMSVGGLAAGMAHEINNPLGAILQNIQNIRRRLRAGLPANEKAARELGIEINKIEQYAESRKIITLLDHIQQAGEKAAHIISSMLQFSRNDYQTMRDVQVIDMIKTTLMIANTDSNLNTPDIQIDIPEELPVITCIPSEIEQVMLNLIKNSQQALDTYKEEQLANNPLWSPSIFIHAKEDKGYICISIADNGPGIADDIVPHIFEPFYTTKDVGEGTGLGLSVSYFIISAHHQGRLIYQKNSAYPGSHFEIHLPLNTLRQAEPDNESF